MSFMLGMYAEVLGAIAIRSTDIAYSWECSVAFFFILIAQTDTRGMKRFALNLSRRDDKLMWDLSSALIGWLVSRPR